MKNAFFLIQQNHLIKLMINTNTKQVVFVIKAPMFLDACIGFSALEVFNVKSKSSSSESSFCIRIKSLPDVFLSFSVITLA